VTYISTKTYEYAFPCCFRQWRAQSHCRFLHGYALTVRIEFEADQLDERNWVVDFGGMKSFKGWLETTFDHKLLVAEDDPFKHMFQSMDHDEHVCETVVVPNTGCEAFAELVYEAAVVWLKDNGYGHRVGVSQVEVREHGGNSAIYVGER
jgi:6-pyruvoyltetrahydropterin/6-carboxytetrahydropterin synthase